MLHIKNLLNIGISDSLDLVETNKQRVFNLFILLALPSIPLVLIINFVMGNHTMAMMNGLQLVVLLFAIWISLKRKLLFLRTFLLILLSSIIFISAIFFKPGMEYRLIFLIVVGVVLFDNNIKFLFYSFLIACEFTICKYLEMKHAGILGSLLVMRILQIFIPFVITSISLFYLKYIYLKSQFKLQNALTEVSNSNEMREKLMFSLAHDLRGPLSNVTGIVNLLKQHQGFSQEELKWLEMIELSSTNSNALLNDLLESNELLKSNVETQLQDLNILVENVVFSSKLKAETKDITIDFQRAEQPCFANVDSVKIDRLISNLLINAIKFSFQSGNIQIKVARQNDFAVISIKDNGIGIAEKNIEFIFDPFTKAKRKGTNNEASFGLGLSICKKITELHGGNIKVLSELGKGSEFIVSLPINN
jgi:signal transduction histidine kinase